MIFMMAPLSCSLITGCQRCVNHEWTRIDTNLMGQTADHTDLGSAPVPGAGAGVPPSRTSLNQSTSSRERSNKCGSGLSAAMVGTLRSLPHSWLDHKKESAGRIDSSRRRFLWGELSPALLRIERELNESVAV